MLNFGCWMLDESTIHNPTFNTAPPGANNPTFKIKNRGFAALMKQENLIVDLSYQFALEIVAAARLMRERKEYDLASQLWRSGTSIGANVEEAQAAQSRADFRSKMSIAAKEARESRYWLRLARDSRILQKDEVFPLLEKIESIHKILTSIVKSSGEGG